MSEIAAESGVVEEREKVDEQEVISNFSKSARSTFWLAAVNILLPFLTPITWGALGFTYWKRRRTYASNDKLTDETSAAAAEWKKGDRYFKGAFILHGLFLIFVFTAIVVLPALYDAQLYAQ